MNDVKDRDLVLPNAPGHEATKMTISGLVARVYEAAPATERCHILEHLMKPLGALSLVAVANGIFAKLWFRSGWHDLHLRPDDTKSIQAPDVVSLVDYVQQASVETIDGLAQLLTASPALANIAAVTLLLTLLARRVRDRFDQGGDVS